MFLNPKKYAHFGKTLIFLKIYIFILFVRRSPFYRTTEMLYTELERNLKI